MHLPTVMVTLYGSIAATPCIHYGNTIVMVIGQTFMLSDSG
jgi:hypothetical protein